MTAGVRIIISIVSLFNSGHTMGLFDWFRSKKASQNGDSAQAPVALPWEGRPSIYEHIKAHIRPGVRGLAEGWERLPDEDRVTKPGKVRWAPGAKDGMFSHHSRSGSDQEQARALFDLVKAYCDDPTDANMGAVYNGVIGDYFYGCVNAFIQMVVEEDLSDEPLQELAANFVVEGADREAVKLGLAIFGFYCSEGIRDIYQVIGRHDEFTLYCVVGLENFPDTAEQELWKLAQQVDGWGRVHTVERLKRTTDPRIQDWLLHEGCRSMGLHQYLAYICAVTGQLHDAITAEQVPDKTLKAAGELISGMLGAEAAVGMDDYHAGAEVVAAYLRLIRDRESAVKDYHNVFCIKEYITDQAADWAALKAHGWTEEVRKWMEAECSAIMCDERWPAIVRRDLESDDDQTLHWANWLVNELGTDKITFGPSGDN